MHGAPEEVLLGGGEVQVRLRVRRPASFVRFWTWTAVFSRCHEGRHDQVARPSAPHDVEAQKTVVRDADAHCAALEERLHTVGATLHVEPLLGLRT